MNATDSLIRDDFWARWRAAEPTRPAIIPRPLHVLLATPSTMRHRPPEATETLPGAMPLILRSDTAGADSRGVR